MPWQGAGECRGRALENARESVEVAKSEMRQLALDSVVRHDVVVL